MNSLQLEFTCFAAAVAVLFIALPVMNCATTMKHGCPMRVQGTVAQQERCSE